jgi:hypothetical protein
LYRCGAWHRDAQLPAVPLAPRNDEQATAMTISNLNNATAQRAELARTVHGARARVRVCRNGAIAIDRDRRGGWLRAWRIKLHARSWHVRSAAENQKDQKEVKQFVAGELPNSTADDSRNPTLTQPA